MVEGACEVFSSGEGLQNHDFQCAFSIFLAFVPSVVARVYFWDHLAENHGGHICL